VQLFLFLLKLYAANICKYLRASSKVFAYTLMGRNVGKTSVLVIQFGLLDFTSLQNCNAKPRPNQMTSRQTERISAVAERTNEQIKKRALKSKQKRRTKNKENNKK